VYEEADGKQVYNQPAGHLDPNETLQEAAIRETLEETGWIVKLTGVVGVNLYEAPADGITYMRTTFIAEAVSLDAGRTLDTAIIEAVRSAYDELRERRAQPRSPMTLRLID